MHAKNTVPEFVDAEKAHADIESNPFTHIL